MPNINGSTEWGPPISTTSPTTSPTRPAKDKIKLKIVSDGTSSGTHVVDRETGEKLESVMAIEWRISVGNYAEAILTLRNVPVEIRTLSGQVSKTGSINRTHKRRIELEK